MAKSKQASKDAPLENFLEKYDLTKRTKREVPYSKLIANQKLDTRVGAGSANDEFATELMLDWEDRDAALTELLKYPIEATGDLTITVGRAAARAYAKLLSDENEPDPKIPIETYDEIPSFNKLSDDSKLCLRLYAVKKDNTKDKRRGLKQVDKLFNMQELLEGGWSKERAIAGAVEAGYKQWQAEDMYAKAKNTLTNRAITLARKVVKQYRNEGRPIPADQICLDHGLDPQRHTKIILREEDTESTRPVALNSLLKKQRWTVGKSQKAGEHWGVGNAQSIINNNMDWYRRSHNRQLAEGERELTGDVFIGRCEAGLEEAVEALKLWQDALTRAKTAVAANTPTKRDQVIAHLRKNAGLK